MSEFAATVIATYSRRMRLRLGDGREVDARIKGKKLRPVCGDHVRTTPIANEDDWLITAVDPRQNELARPNASGRKEVLAANVDLVVVVAAPAPKPDWFIVDRYLCAAEIMRADGLVVFNKIDLADGARDALQVYDDIGYDTVRTSAETGDNIEEFGKLLADRTAIIVGQSGVGKSSLINRLTSEAWQKTADISAKRGEGRHTTVNSAMIPLPGGGEVIDSPGVRDYAPMLQTIDDAIVGYKEIHRTGEGCRFANCKHLKEPGCAVKAAVEAAEIDARRYESYRRSIILMEQLTRDRY